MAEYLEDIRFLGPIYRLKWITNKKIPSRPRYLFVKYDLISLGQMQLVGFEFCLRTVCKSIICPFWQAGRILTDLPTCIGLQTLVMLSVLTPSLPSAYGLYTISGEY